MTFQYVGRRMSQAVAVCAVLLLTACSTLSPKSPEVEAQAAREKMDARMQAANAAIEQGQTDKAFEQLDQAVKANPGAKEPWLRKAQIRFEAREYGHAINDAKEVLQRDVNDVTAQSILAVSGLRVSADALAFLRNVDAVKGSTRSEAESVAKLLRESLGETILVPAAAEPAAQPVVKPKRTPVRRATTPVSRPAVAVSTAPATAPVTPAAPLTASVTPKPQAKPAASTTGARSNPFGALK